MIRLTRYLTLSLIALALIIVAMANRTPVLLHVLPDDLGALVGFNYEVELPLFMILFGGVAVGILIGFVWEWLREGKHRAEVMRQAREVAILKREVARAGLGPKAPADDVLALIEGTRKTG